VHLFINQSFSPAPDECLGDLYKATPCLRAAPGAHAWRGGIGSGTQSGDGGRMRALP